MEIQLVPEPGGDEPAARAVVAAVERAGVAPPARPEAYDGAWRRAGLAEAVERSLSVGRAGTTGGEPGAALATQGRSVRSTRGATRA